MNDHISITGVVVGCGVTELAELCRRAHIIHEMMSPDRKNRPATGSSQGLGLEAHLNTTSQGKLVLPVPTVGARNQAKEGLPENARLPALRDCSSERKTAISASRSRRFVDNTG